MSTTIISGSIVSGLKETEVVSPPNKRLVLRHWIVELMEELDATPEEIIEELNIVCRIRQEVARQEAEEQERKLY